MWTIALFSTVLTVTSALTFAPDFPPLNLNTTCAASLCAVGTTCKEETQGTITRARCVEDEPVDPCATVRCGFGQVCVLQKVYCIRAPCNPQPTCVDNNEVKPGRCRKPSPFEAGICASNCQRDGECPGPQKCCRNGCGATTCQDPEGLIPEPTGPTCDTMRCEPGQKCVLQEVLCIRSPCFPRPTCVDDIKVKPGRCRKPSPFEAGICANTCQRDHECPGPQKCCRNGCGATTCQDPEGLIPEPTGPTCDTMRCEPGQKCVLQKVLCIRSPCFPQPTCVDDISKPGQCPKPGPLELGICASDCKGDGECPGSQKCCRNACGSTTCQSPEVPVLIPVKPSCKTVKCGPGEKCVMQQVRCFVPPCPEPRPECVPADKPGVCPRTRPSRFSFFFCRQRCQGDAQCPGAQKCCRSGCSAVCKDPELPPRPIRTCATVDCLPDHVCKMRTRCDRQGCVSVPRCEPVKRCPVYPAWINPNCVPKDLCWEKDPNACAPGTLCCATDCGRRCVRPL